MRTTAAATPRQPTSSAKWRGRRGDSRAGATCARTPTRGTTRAKPAASPERRSALGWAIFLFPDKGDRENFASLPEMQAHKMNGVGGGAFLRPEEWDTYGQTVSEIIALFERGANSLTLRESPARAVVI